MKKKAEACGLNGETTSAKTTLESPLDIIKEQDDSETGAIACLDWRVCFQNSILSSADDISTTIYWPVAVLPRKNLSAKKEQQNTVSLSVWQSNKALL